MRWMVLVTGLLATAYCGFWFVGRADRLAAVAEVEAALQAQGIAVGYHRATTRGFPSRHDTKFERLILERGALALVLPEVEVAALSYRPRDLIVTFPDRIEMHFFDVGDMIEAERLRASLSVDPTGVLQRLTLEGTGLSTVGNHVERLLFALRWQGGGRYDLYFEMSGARFGETEVSSLRTEGALTLSAPLGAASLSDWPGVVSYEVRSARATVDGENYSGRDALRAAEPAWLTAYY